MYPTQWQINISLTHPHCLISKMQQLPHGLLTQSSERKAEMETESDLTWLQWKYIILQTTWPNEHIRTCWTSPRRWRPVSWEPHSLSFFSLGLYPSLHILRELGHAPAVPTAQSTEPRKDCCPPQARAGLFSGGTGNSRDFSTLPHVAVSLCFGPSASVGGQERGSLYQKYQRASIAQQKWVGNWDLRLHSLLVSIIHFPQDSVVLKALCILFPWLQTFSLQHTSHIPTLSHEAFPAVLRPTDLLPKLLHILTNNSRNKYLLSTHSGLAFSSILVACLQKHFMWAHLCLARL